MARTVGQVHEMTWIAGAPNVYVRVGPSPSISHTSMLTVILDGTPSRRALKATIVDTLARAMLARREVVLWHEDNGLITTIDLEAA